VKRLVGLSIAVATAALALGVSALAAPDTKGPPCSDFVSGGGTYSTATAASPDIAVGDRVVGFDMQLGSPSCSFVTYTLYVTDVEGHVLASQTTSGTSGLTSFSLTANLGVDGPTSVCVYATSTLPSGRIADTAPDDGCSSPSSPGTLALDAGPGNEYG
jgi:hypothetical protein